MIDCSYPFEIRNACDDLLGKMEEQQEQNEDIAEILSEAIGATHKIDEVS